MPLNEPTARSILEAAHAAWSKQNIDGMLDWYDDRLTYFCNVGGADGGELRLYGKADMRAFLSPVTAVADCVTVPFAFTFSNGIGRAQIEVYIKHRESGNLLHGTYRQVVEYRDYKIFAVEEFHDAARMRAFWAMVLGPAIPDSKNSIIVSKLLRDALTQKPPFDVKSSDD